MRLPARKNKRELIGEFPICNIRVLPVECLWDNLTAPHRGVISRYPIRLTTHAEMTMRLKLSEELIDLGICRSQTQNNVPVRVTTKEANSIAQKSNVTILT